MGARFLVVEDEAPTAKHLARLIRAHGAAVVARTVQEALARLADFLPWSGFIIDVGLPDGSGLDVLASARLMHPTTPALVLTGDTERETINRAYSLGAGYLVKPIATEAIESFLVGASGVGFAARVERVLQAWARRYAFSAAQVDVLRRAAMGADRRAIAIGRETSELTVKRQGASILTLTKDSSFHAAVERLLREVAGTP